MPEQETTILVIDDDEPILTLMETVLRAYGYRAVVARSGAAALAVTRESRPDLILLDLHMPGMDGKDVLDRLRSDKALRSIPVLILSGDRVNDADIVARGAVGAIQKPFDLPQLIGEIEKHLAAKGSRVES